MSGGKNQTSINEKLYSHFKGTTRRNVGAFIFRGLQVKKGIDILAKQKLMYSLRGDWVIVMGSN